MNETQEFASPVYSITIIPRVEFEFDSEHERPERAARDPMYSIW